MTTTITARPVSASPTTASPTTASPTTASPTTVAAPLPRSAYALLADAGRGLGRAIRAGQPADRFAAAHLAALRGAAAVLAVRAHPRRAARGSAWDLLPRVAPELTDWAVFFAAGSAKRQAAEAGVATGISPREADDLVRQTAAFLDLVDRTLGLS